MCDAIHGLCRVAWPAAELPEGAEQRVLTSCDAGMAEERIQLEGLAIDACWSAVVAGVASRSNAARAFRARIPAMALRPAAVARARDRFS